MPSNIVVPGRAATNAASDDRRRRWTSLFAACVAVAVVWLIVLPALARIKPIQSHIERMDRAKIDPSAMFYTEIEGMDEIRDKVDAWRRGDSR